MSVTLEIAVILALVLANGVFALAEIALVSARRVRLQAAADAGDRSAAAAVALKDAPERFLSTVQVGITLIGVVAGAVGGATLSGRLAPLLARWEPLAEHSLTIALAIVVAAITYLSVVIGELVPKQLAIAHAEWVSRVLARPMLTVEKILGPAVWLLSKSSALVVRMLGIRTPAGPPVTEEEIVDALEQGASTGVIEEAEHDVIERVMRLADRRVAALMTHRTQIVWLDVSADAETIVRRIAEEPHTYFPVCEGDIDKLLGIVNIKELWKRQVAEGRFPDLRSCVAETTFVPEAMPALRLLETFKRTGQPIAVVLDEYGGIAGLATLHDMLEGVVGDIRDEPDTVEDRAVQRPDGSWLLDGMLPIDELMHVLDIPTLPEPAADSNTLAGLILSVLGHIPRVSESVELAGYRLEVVDLDNYRIDRVLATRLKPAASGDAAPPRAESRT